MKTSSFRPGGSAFETAATLARWLLGAFFLHAGLGKALHPVEFLKLVRQYDLATMPLLLNSISACLPWFEVFCGVLLMLGVAVRGTAAILAAMLVPFTLLVLKHALAIQSALGLAFCAVKFDCGCGTGEVFICHKLVENSLLMILLLFLASGQGRRLSARYSLMK